jgi:hypothetical protein
MIHSLFCNQRVAKSNETGYAHSRAKHCKNNNFPEALTTKKRFCENLGRTLWLIGAILFIVMAIILICLAFTRTVIFQDQSYELATILYWSDSQGIFLMTRGLLAAFFLVGVLFMIYKFGDYLNFKIVLVVFIFLSTIFSIHALLDANLGAHGFPDAMSLMTYASDVVTDGWDTINPLAISHEATIPTAYNYFSSYPFQVGCFLYFVLVFKLFGAWNVFALEMINIIANEVTILALIGMSWQITVSKRLRIASIIATSSSVPFLISASFPYGNSVGFAFTCLFLWAQLNSLKANSATKKTTWQVFSFVPLAFGMIIKPTFVLVALGVLAARVIDAFRRKQWLQLVVAISIVFLADFMVGLPTTWIENKLQLDFGDGIPSSAWIEIGLSESENLNGQPGWWDPTALENYTSTDGDYAVQDILAKKGIQKAIYAFIQDPLYFFNFMSTKLSTEWTEPTYQSLMFYGLNTDSNGTLTGYTSYQSIPITAYMRGYQIVLYVGFFLETLLVFYRGKKCVDASYLILCTVFVGFICYLIWEAKSLYLLPFSMLMIPLAVHGYYQLFNLLQTRKKKAQTTCHKRLS